MPVDSPQARMLAPTTNPWNRGCCHGTPSFCNQSKEPLSPHRPPGLSEELVTPRLEAALDEIRGDGWRDEIDSLDPAEAPGVLARFVHDLVESGVRHLRARASGSFMAR